MLLVSFRDRSSCFFQVRPEMILNAFQDSCRHVYCRATQEKHESRIAHKGSSCLKNILTSAAHANIISRISALRLPKDKLIVFTGVSGSGKSSLAFDTIYAEGQRRYIESLSAYARQFLGQLERPDVDFIGGLSPSISIDQNQPGTTLVQLLPRLQRFMTTCAFSSRASVHRIASNVVGPWVLKPETRLSIRLRDCRNGREYSPWPRL